MATGGEQGWRREGLHSERSDRREAVAVIQVEGTESGSSRSQIRMKRRGWIQRLVRGGMNWEFGIDIYILLRIKQITNEHLLYNTGDFIQCSVVT